MQRRRGCDRSAGWRRRGNSPTTCALVGPCVKSSADVRGRVELEPPDATDAAGGRAGRVARRSRRWCPSTAPRRSPWAAMVPKSTSAVHDVRQAARERRALRVRAVDEVVAVVVDAVVADLRAHASACRRGCPCSRDRRSRCGRRRRRRGCCCRSPGPGGAQCGVAEAAGILAVRQVVAVVVDAVVADLGSRGAGVTAAPPPPRRRAGRARRRRRGPPLPPSARRRRSPPRPAVPPSPPRPAALPPVPPRRRAPPTPPRPALLPPRAATLPPTLPRVPPP